jgi:hypothetical protein
MQFICAIAEDMCKITLPRLSMLYSLLTCFTTDAHDTCDIAEDMCRHLGASVLHHHLERNPPDVD